MMKRSYTYIHSPSQKVHILGGIGLDLKEYSYSVAPVSPVSFYLLVVY